jgi:hypothetical protein
VKTFILESALLTVVARASGLEGNTLPGLYNNWLTSLHQLSTLDGIKDENPQISVEFKLARLNDTARVTIMLAPMEHGPWATLELLTHGEHYTFFDDWRDQELPRDDGLTTLVLGLKKSLNQLS